MPSLVHNIVFQLMQSPICPIGLIYSGTRGSHNRYYTTS